MRGPVKYHYALRLLKELNCPAPIMEALEVWGYLIREDEIKLHNWESLGDGGIIESVAREILEVKELCKERKLNGAITQSIR